MYLRNIPPRLLTDPMRCGSVPVRPIDMLPYDGLLQVFDFYVNALDSDIWPFLPVIVQQHEAIKSTWGADDIITALEHDTHVYQINP
jgi:hypothetical protein